MGFNVKNLSNVKNLEAFVSKYTKDGNDGWFTVPSTFDSSSSSHWDRNGWELVAFKDPATNIQRGWYLDCKGQTVDITFYGFNQDLGLVRK
ncbi:hypothetical protein B0H34DRAFT_200343 [Crassisporium funariophilum]|nr:hypothetical protein B0H34DRAFT_200343 [Crassisporium funariophilum]